MSSQVEVHSGYEYEEKPIAFWVEKTRHAVNQIVKEWHDPQGKHFTVTDTTGELFELVYLTETSDWQVKVASQSVGS